MDAFLICVSRWMLAILLVFGAMQQSELISIQEKPDNPTNVTLGQTQVSVCKWEFTPDSGETIQTIFIKIEKPGDIVATQIASRSFSGSFDINKNFPDYTNYIAKLNAELLLKKVKKNEDFLCILSIVFKDSNGFQQKDYPVRVEVKVPPEITVVPERKPLVVADQNLTLRCNASGDPRPHITWTRDGIPPNQFNVSGGWLHLVNVQRKDLGSYRCTASNGYGSNATSVSIVSMKCNNDDCQEDKTVGLTIVSEEWKQAYSNQASIEFRNMESRVLAAIWEVYTNNLGKQLYLVTVSTFRSGSVDAIVVMKFGKSANNPLTPLEDKIKGGKLGSFTVNPELDKNPTTSPPTISPESTTGAPVEPPSSDERTSGLSESELWGIIGGCIAFVILIVIIIIVCCICKKKKNTGGASKSGKSTYSEADGYRMNRQQPPSGLGTASPAYVEARHYAPVNPARRQDDEPKQLNYADLSFNKSSAPAKQPPPYSSTEYSEPSHQKQGGQQEEGFQLWC